MSGKLNESQVVRVGGSQLNGAVMVVTANKENDADGLLNVDITNSRVGVNNASPSNDFDIREFGFKYVTQDIDVATDGATTSTGLTPTGIVFGMAVSVISAITGLDSADHHLQVGITGDTDKYIDVANGEAATSIAVNTKDEYSLNPANAADGSEIIFTITGGADQTPTAGTVRIRYLCLNPAAIADV